MKIKKKSAVILCGVFCTALTAVPVLADTEVQKYTNTDLQWIQLCLKHCIQQEMT